MNTTPVRIVRSIRSGFSLIELVVVLLVLLIVASVVLTSIQAARAHSRLQVCANNQKELALAVTNRASGHKGKFPLFSEEGPGLAWEAKVPWIIPLLPYLERHCTLGYIQPQSREAAFKELNNTLAHSIEMLQCPDDVNHFGKPGGLSFGGNIGYGAWKGTPQGIQTAYDFGESDHSAASIDWNDSRKLDPTDKEIARATGVFWPADADGFRMTLDTITKGDGTGQTILFGENVTLPPMHQAGPLKNGHDPSPLDAGIGIGYSALGLTKQETPDLALDRRIRPTAEYEQYFAPISNCRPDQPRSPRVSSMHSGLVNVAYADGHVTKTSTSINWDIWASLLSPNGVNHCQKPVGVNIW